MQQQERTKVLVRLDEGQFPDFVLECPDRELPFEVTETLRPEQSAGKGTRSEIKIPCFLCLTGPARRGRARTPFVDPRVGEEETREDLTHPADALMAALLR